MLGSSNEHLQSLVSLGHSGTHVLSSSTGNLVTRSMAKVAELVKVLQALSNWLSNIKKKGKPIWTYHNIEIGWKRAKLWPKVFNAVNVDVSKFKDYTSRTQWPTQITVAAVGANLLLNRWTATFLAVEQLAAADERPVWWRFPHPVESMDLPKKLETEVFPIRCVALTKAKVQWTCNEHVMNM